MKKAIVIHHSKTGTTKKFAENIGKYLAENNISVQVSAIGEVTDNNLSGFDYVLLGCWTSGLFIILQKPEKVWTDFASKLPAIESSKLILFTTFKVRTGSMFGNMRKHMKFKNGQSVTEIKSRKGELDVNSKKLLQDFIN